MVIPFDGTVMSAGILVLAAAASVCNYTTDHFIWVEWE
jgi:hypothetical protein